MSWLFGGNANQTQFDEAVDNATSELLPSGSDETLLTSLQLSDQIRSKSVDASYALKSLRRRTGHKNPNVQIQALHVLDVLVKNSGEAFLLAVGNSKDGWMAELEELCKSSNADLRQTATKYLQNWALAFQSTSTSSALSSSDLINLYNRLRYSITFPPPDQAVTSNMISSLSAPEWVDSDLCQRCRTPFTLTNRKHHCRNCGGIFCGDCSSKTMKLEHLGIDQEVRVCDGCYKKLQMPGGRSASISHQRVASSTAFQGNGAKKSQEEIDFERAIALSLAETKSSAPSDPFAQSNSLPGVGYGYEAKPSKPSSVSQYPSASASAMPSKQLEEEDPDLAAAIRASLAEAQPQASTSTAASAPPKSSYTYAPVVQPSVPSYELAVSEFDALDSFSNALRDPHIRPDDANELFTRADRHRGKMYRALEDAHAKSSMLAELNQKLQHAVRLYDSLLERNISRYSQPYQVAAPQQYYQNQQQPNQPYHNPPVYHPQQQYQPQSNQPQSYAPQQQQPQYSNAPQMHTHGSHQEHRQQEYASPPALRQANSYQYQEQPQAYEEQRVEGYSNTQGHSGQSYEAHYAGGAGPTSPKPQQSSAPIYEGQQAASANVDEQYYNPYPTDAAEQSVPYENVNGYSQEQHAEQQAPQAYPDTHQQQTMHQQYQQPQMGGPSNHQEGAPSGPRETSPTQQPETVSNGRFQGFYSAASFPVVPSMPVGGLPSAPKGQFEQEEAAPIKQENRKEEALIEF